MTETIINPLLSKPRIVNLSKTDLQGDGLLPIDLNDQAGIIATIRRYSDMPQVYVVDEEQIELVSALLTSLEKIRSTCYPHALFVVSGDFSLFAGPDLDIVSVDSPDADVIMNQIDSYAQHHFAFNKSRLDYKNSNNLPEQTEVLIVGGGITGLYAAHRLAREGLSFCVVEERAIAGGIWTKDANATSQVNTSEGAYRLLDKEIRANRDHSTTAEILTDMHQLFTEALIRSSLHKGTRGANRRGGGGQYRVSVGPGTTRQKPSPAKASYSRSMIVSAAPVK